MRFGGSIHGIVSKWSKDSKTPTFEPKQIQVEYTSDLIGKTLSLGSKEDGILISVPYETIERMIKKGGK